jgi:NAD(P)-dependent dehydrogenase (short-subunit alcohol dehydrogenase family)
MTAINLAGSVALVTGATRGVGHGVAVGLARAGATTYATGRTIGSATFAATVERVTCDHTDDAAVAAVFARIDRDAGRLDILVNVAWGGYERMMEDGRFTWVDPFWKQSRWRWDAMMTAGVRGAYVASALAAERMVERRRGLIVHISSWAAQKSVGNVVCGVAKAATDKMAADMAHELKAHGVTVVSLYPGLVRTESVLAAGFFDLSNSESPEFLGRVISALAADPDVQRLSGQVVIAAALAQDYGVTDIDGKQPRPLTLADL